MKLTKSAQSTALRLWMKLTGFEEIFEEYKHSDWIQKKALPDASWFW